MLEAGLNVDNNHCHNALEFQASKPNRPWCYFGRGAWGYCDVPTCEQFCSQHATVATTAYMTSTTSPKSIRPIKHPKGKKDPFVSCWNKCFNSGLENGPNCMDVCMKVSLIKLTTCSPTEIIFKNLNSDGQVKHHDKSYNYNPSPMRQALLICFPRNSEIFTCTNLMIPS